jgi:hypothetical protein
LIFSESVLHKYFVHLHHCYARLISGIIIVDVCLVIMKVFYIIFQHVLSLCHQCTPLLIDSEFQWRKLTSPNSIIWLFAGQSFQFCCHYISTYTMNSIWLAFAPSVACYPPLQVLPSTKKTQYWVTQRVLYRETYLFNMLGICIWGEHGCV